MHFGNLHFDLQFEAVENHFVFLITKGFRWLNDRCKMQSYIPPILLKKPSLASQFITYKAIAIVFYLVGSENWEKLVKFIYGPLPLTDVSSTQGGSVYKKNPKWFIKEEGGVNEKACILKQT
jgi:hypothetical protein